MLLVYVIVHIIIHVILILILQPIHVTYVHIIVIVATNETDNPNAWGFQSTVFYALNPLWSFPLREV